MVIAMNSILSCLVLLSLLLLHLNLCTVASASEPVNSDADRYNNSSNSKTFRDERPRLQTAVDRVIGQIEGLDNSSFTFDERISYYTIVYELCTDRQGEKNSKMLYDQYKKVFDEYVNSTVLPSLRVEEDEALLIGLLRRWSNHKTMTYWLSIFFQYLNRYHIPRWGLPSLEEIGLSSFHDLVYGEMNKQITDAVSYMIGRENAGEHIDSALLDNVFAMYTDLGDVSRKYHAKGFEEMLEDITAFCFDEVSNWMARNFYEDPNPKIGGEHAGEHIESALLDNVFAMYTNLGGALRKYHAKGFVEMLEDITAFYFDEVSNWMARNFYEESKPKIGRKHAGEHIDSALLDNAFAMYSDLGGVSRKYHAKGFVEMLEDITASCFDVVSNWMAKNFYEDPNPKIGRKHAGEHIESALLDNVFAMYTDLEGVLRKYHAKGFVEMLEDITGFYFDAVSSWMASNLYEDLKPKEEKSEDLPIKPTEKVYLKSFDGDIFEVNYDAALMLESIKDIVESEASSATNSTIPLKASSRILIKVIQYCHKHVQSSVSKDKTSGVDLKEWDAKFVEVDNTTLFELIQTSNYLNIKSLLDLTIQKVADMIKGMTPEEIRDMFNIKDEFDPKEEEEFLKEKE